MDIEQLTKSQTILLTLLVSFVTSIATGIVTVTLMDQAPPAMVQTVHKVVEKTIETVVPAKSQSATIVNETIIVKEENLIADVIEKNKNSFIRINKIQEGAESFSGFGIIVDKSGIILTSKNNIQNGATYSTLIKGKVIALDVVKINEDKDVAYLKATEKESGIFKSFFNPSTIADSESLKLGQSVVALNGIQSTEISTGIISGITKDSKNTDNISNEDNTSTTSTTEESSAIEPKIVIVSIKTNISNNGVMAGAPLLNMEGKVIGLNTDSSSSFTPLDFVSEEITSILTVASNE